MVVYTDKHQIPFQIDEDDYFVVAKYFWYIDINGYPRTNIRREGYNRFGKRNQQGMQLSRFLLGKAPHGLIWDHKNQDKLDNQRENIRAVTRIINGRNKGLQSNNPSGVNGVSRWRHKWQVTIVVAQKKLLHRCIQYG